MNFTYKALKGKEIVKGSVSAKTKKDAIQTLKAQGFRPISLEENIEKNNAVSFNSKFKARDLYFLFTQLALMLKSGILIDTAIKISADNFTDKKRDTLLKIAENLNRGLSLSESMDINNNFSDFVINLVEVGQNSSNLVGVFENLANFYKKEDNLKKKVISTISYPLILLIVSFIVVNFLMLSVIPAFADIYEEAGSTLPLFTRILIALPSFLRNHFLMIGLGLIVFISLLIMYFKSHREVWDRILLRNSYYKKVYTLRFSFTIYILLSSGLNIDKATESLVLMEKNSLIRRKLNGVINNLKKGEAYWLSLRNMNIFPKIFISMVKIGEESSNFKEIFKNFREYYEEDLENYNKRFLDILGPSLIIILAIIIGFIVLSIALPIFNMVNTI